MNNNNVDVEKIPIKLQHHTGNAWGVIVSISLIPDIDTENIKLTYDKAIYEDTPPALGPEGFKWNMQHN